MGVTPLAFTSTLLNTGEVLIAGGQIGKYPNLATTGSAHLFDPSTSIWSATGSMNQARQSHRATRLTNGQVLVEGGEVIINDRLTYLASAELYTP
jgi:hypothetical protein